MTISAAKRKARKRRDRFVVGYLGAGNIVFSSSKWQDTPLVGPVPTTAIEPMTLRQAQCLVKTMPCYPCAIFELVPVEINDRVNSHG